MKKSSNFHPVDLQVFALYIVELISVTQIHIVFVLEYNLWLLSVHDMQRHQSLSRQTPPHSPACAQSGEVRERAVSANTVPLKRCVSSGQTATGAVVVCIDKKIRTGGEEREVSSCTPCLSCVVRGFILLKHPLLTCA